jgi:hypothetical protein
MQPRPNFKHWETNMKTMTRRQLVTRMKAIRNRGDAMALAADLYPTRQDCEGTLAARFVSGCFNAADMQDVEKTIAADDDATFVRYCFTEVENVEPEWDK